MANAAVERPQSRFCSYELVSYKVEDEVYRVPRHGFAEFSEVFQTMFSLPQADGVGEGQAAENPIVLHSCTKVDFESLLDVLYPAPACVKPAPPSKDTYWTGVLKLATMWSMDEIRELAISEIADLPIDTLDKIILAKTYRVPSLLIDGYVKLVEDWHTEHSSLDDIGDRLGWESTARVAELALMSKPCPSIQPGHTTAHVKMTCYDCQMETTVAVPLQEPCRARKCGLCGQDVLQVVWTEREAPPRPSHLRGEALQDAVENQFRKELEAMYV